jgi:hypothetical protein
MDEAKIRIMTKVIASADSQVAFIAGHGVLVPEEFVIAPGITIRSNPPRFDLQVLANGCETLSEYAVVHGMMEYASFYLEIREDAGGEELAVKTWNSLWLFPLLSIACQCPCTSLYSWSGSQKVSFSVSTPFTAFRKPEDPIQASNDQLSWARTYIASFDAIQKDETFITALMSYSNSHHLFGNRPRIMQLWSGIECLFKVSSEISRTLAMYSALLLEEGDANSRYKCFKEIKKDYSVRSKVVHGTIEDEDVLRQAYTRASKLLARLLSRCVELSRVPTTEEFDRAALVGHIVSKPPRPSNAASAIH